MSFVITLPEQLSAAAGRLQAIGAAVSAANAAAAFPTTGVVPASADAVSAMTAARFAGYGQMYQAIGAQAGVIHEQFVQTLGASANAYADTDAINAMQVAGGHVATGTPARMVPAAPARVPTGPARVPAGAAAPARVPAAPVVPERVASAVPAGAASAAPARVPSGPARVAPPRMAPTAPARPAPAHPAPAPPASPTRFRGGAYSGYGAPQGGGWGGNYTPHGGGWGGNYTPHGGAYGGYTAPHGGGWGGHGLHGGGWGGHPAPAHPTPAHLSLIHI